MTIRIPENGDDSRPENNFANFASAWPNSNNDDDDEPSNDDKRSINRQPQHHFQSFTGVRINMAGELLTGMMNDHDSHSSEELLDSVELGIIEEGKTKAAASVGNHDNSTSTQKQTTNDTSDTSSSEEARNDGEGVEVSYRSDGHQETREKKKLKYERLRVWKSQVQMVVCFSVIGLIFVFLAIRSRAGDDSIAFF